MASAPLDTLARFEDQVTVSLPMTSYVQASEGSGDVVLLLHGYQDHAEAFFRRVFPKSHFPYHILAPNSPFPAPIRTDEGYREAYSWFFADRSKGQVLLHPEVAIDALAQWVEKRGYDDHRKIIVGFSQGGYFAPFAARGLKKVIKIIGVGSGYRVADYAETGIDDVDAIHGDRDDIVSYEHALKSFEALRPQLKAGEFLTISGLKHGIDDRTQKLIQTRIALGFSQTR